MVAKAHQHHKQELPPQRSAAPRGQHQLPSSCGGRGINTAAPQVPHGHHHHHQMPLPGTAKDNQHHEATAATPGLLQPQAASIISLSCPCRRRNLWLQRPTSIISKSCHPSVLQPHAASIISISCLILQPHAAKAHRQKQLLIQGFSGSAGPASSASDASCREHKLWPTSITATPGFLQPHAASIISIVCPCWGTSCGCKGPPAS